MHLKKLSEMSVGEKEVYALRLQEAEIRVEIAKENLLKAKIETEEAKIRRDAAVEITRLRVEEEKKKLCDFS